MCQAYAYVMCVFTSVSVWTIAALSWDKYQTIASPLHHSLTATIQKMLPCFLLFWTCGLILSLPPLFGANEYAFHSAMGICGVNSSSTAGRWYTCMLVCLSFIFPFCLMIYCYAHIFRIARTQSGRIAATMLRMVSVIQAPIAPATQSSLSLRGTKAMSTILQLIGSFVLTYLPYAIIILYEVIFAVHANTIFVSIATTLFLAAPFTHAAIYGIRNQILRKSFYRYARMRFQHCCHQDKRRGSVKYHHAQPKSSTNIRMPMKSILKKESNRQYILRRTISYHGVEGQESIYNNGHSFGMKSVLPRPHSFDVLRYTNGRPITPTHDEIPNLASTTDTNNTKKEAANAIALASPTLSSQATVHWNNEECKEDSQKSSGISFSEKYRLRSNFGKQKSISRWTTGFSEEVSFYSKDISLEISMIDKEMDEISRYDDIGDERMIHLAGGVTIDNPSMTVLIDEESAVFHSNDAEPLSYV